jgi:ribose-phosphate pyrophosphokinase
MELLIMIDAARRASASRVTAVLPFFGYARQDRKDQPRVPITSKLVANLLVAAGANRILTMDLHAQQIQGFFDIPVDHLYASPVFFDALKEENTDNLTVFSPDVGGLKMANAYAEMLGCPLGFVAKRRTGATTVEAMNLVGEVEGRDILIIDDMTETAGTLVAAATLLKERGANTVRAIVSHGVLNEIGRERLRQGALDELITTNTVQLDTGELPIRTLSVAPLLGEAIHRTHTDSSISSLFQIKGF